MNNSIYFNRSADFEMNNYDLANKTKFTIAQDEGIAIIASNPFVNGTPTIFEIQYQEAEYVGVGFIFLMVSQLFSYFIV